MNNDEDNKILAGLGLRALGNDFSHAENGDTIVLKSEQIDMAKIYTLNNNLSEFVIESINISKPKIAIKLKRRLAAQDDETKQL